MTEKFEADNSWVVPHNRFLLCKYNAHINVECSASISAVQYLYSYITKGNRPVVASVRHDDEIKAFSEARVTSSASAIWQTLGFPSHKQSPSIIRLGFRLPQETSVVFHPSDSVDEIMEAANSALSRPTELSSWFLLNQTDVRARTLTYVTVPEHYVYKEKERCWVRRQRNMGTVLGRLYPVDVSNREAFALRLLLHEVKGCTCVEDIRKVGETQFSTFVEAAMALGIMDNHREWIDCLNQASSKLHPELFRGLFSVILECCQPVDPVSLLSDFFDLLTADIEGSRTVKESALFKHLTACCELDKLGLDVSSFPTLLGSDIVDVYHMNEVVSHPTEHIRTSDLTPDQLIVHNAFISSIRQRNTRDDANDCNVFILLAPAGCGKTFVINSMLQTAHEHGMRVVPCATSALAASLMGHCRTAHTTFKIPMNLDDSTVIRMNSKHKDFLRSIDAFIWDEVSMAHKWAVDAVDRLLRDLHHNDRPFGGVSMLFVGDFRQLLPVHKFAPDPSSYCIKSCNWYASAVTLTLHANIRASDPDWASFVLNIGNGHTPVTFPNENLCSDADALLNAVWPETHDGNRFRGNRSILTTTRCFVFAYISGVITLILHREDAATINEKILALIPGVQDCAISLDEALDCDAKHYPVEFVNTVSISGLPEHVLTLKKGICLYMLRFLEFQLSVGAHYMVVRNISKYLFNGTRVIYHRRIAKCLEVEISSGSFKGKVSYVIMLHSLY